MNRNTALLLFAATATTLNAAQILDSTTGLASPATTISFSEVALASDTPLSNQFAAYGVAFSNLFFNTDYSFGFSVVAPGAANFDADLTIYNPYSLFFSTPQTDVAFGLVTNPGDTTTVTARLAGNDIDSFSFSTNFAGHFFGFTGLSGFDEIHFTTTGPNGGNAIIDTIQVGTPEPATKGTGGGAAVLLLALAARLRRRIRNY